MLIGIAAGVLGKLHLDIVERLRIADEMKVLTGSLVGVVFSSLALVIGLMSERYALWLASTTGGVAAFLRPFFVSVGLQVGALLSVVLYRAVAASVPAGLEQAIFGILCGVFVVAILDVVSLAKTVFAHGVARADAAELDRMEDENEARRKEC